MAAMAFIDNIVFWIIAFFVSAVLLIMMFVVFIIIKMKTHAFIELKAFVKKCPVSMFMDDGRIMDMRAIKVENGTIVDKDYGMFIRNKMNGYMSKQTRGIFDFYDAHFSPGINIKAAHSAEVLKGYLDDDDYLKLGDLMISNTLSDKKIDCLKTNINTSHLKDLFNNIEPHNINASVEKKIAQKMRSMNQKGNMQILLIFLGVFGAIIAAYVLLKMFNISE